MGHISPRMDEGNRGMNPSQEMSRILFPRTRSARACAPHVAHLVASHAAVTAMPGLHAFPLLTIWDLREAARSLKVVTSVTCVTQPRHRAICPVHRDSSSGFHLQGFVSLLGESMAGAKSWREFVQLSTRHPARPCDVCMVPDAEQRSTQDGDWPPGARARLAQEVSASLRPRISKSVCEMVSRSQLWIQASTLRCPLGFLRFSPIISLARRIQVEDAVAKQVTLARCASATTELTAPLSICPITPLRTRGSNLLCLSTIRAEAT